MSTASPTPDASTAPPCLDCGRPIPDGVSSKKYPAECRAWPISSACYLCADCRTHRYTSELQAINRCRAHFARLQGRTDFGWQGAC